MMKSTKLMNSTYNSLLKRTLIFALILMGAGGRMWADGFTPQASYPTATVSDVLVGDDNTIKIDGSALLASSGIASSTSSPFYVRFYLTDASDNGVAITNLVSLDQYNNNWYSGDYVDFGTLGKACYKGGYPGTDLIAGQTITLTIPASHTGYKLYCYLSNQSASEWNSPTYNEPAIDVAFEYNLKSLSDLTWNAGSEASSTEHRITKIINTGQTSATLDLYADAWDDVISSGYSPEDLYDTYIKWYLRNKSTGDIVSASGAAFSSPTAPTTAAYGSNPFGYVWTSKNLTEAYSHGLSGIDYGTNYSWRPDEAKKVLKVSFTVPSGNVEDYEAVMVMTGDLTGLEETSGYITTEPAFQHKFVYQFMTTSDLDDAFTAGDDAGATVVNRVVKHDGTKASVNLNAYMDEIVRQLGITKSALSDFYLRWYLTKDGKPVEDKSVYSAGGQLLSFDSNYDTQAPDLFINKKEGKIFYEKLHGNDYIADFSNTNRQGAKNVTFTLPSGDEWSQYRIVCVMTDAATAGGVDAGDGGSDFHGVSPSNDVLITEPTIKLKYVFEPLTDAEMDARYAPSAGTSAAMADAYQGVKLVSDPTATSIDVNIADTDIFADYTKTAAFGDADETDQFVYARFFLTNANGTPIDMTDYTLSTVTTPLPAGVKSQTLANGQLLVYAPVSGFTDGLLNIHIATTGTPSWDTVRLAAVIANDATGFATGNDMLDTTDKLAASYGMKVVSEPDAFLSAWSAKLITDAEDLFIESSEAGCQTRIVYQLLPTTQAFTADLNYYQRKILADFDQTLANLSTHFYLRAYLSERDKATPLTDDSGNRITMKNSLSATGGNDHAAQKYGLIWKSTGANPTLAANPAQVLNAQVNLGSADLATLSLEPKDVELVYLLTDDLTGIGATKGGLTVSADPKKLKWKYIVRFITEDEAGELEYVTTTSKPTKTYKSAKNIAVLKTVTSYDDVADELQQLYTAATATGEALDGKTPQYARFYITSASGKVLGVLPTTFAKGAGNTLTYQDKGTDGWVWAGTGFDISAVGNLTLNKPDGMEWSDLRLVCDLTDDLASGYQVGDIVIEEPTNIAARLILRFKDTEDEYSSTESINLERSETKTYEHDANLTDVVFDLADAEHFSEVDGAFTNQLSAHATMNNLYVRWYLADKDGDWVQTPEGITLTPVGTGYTDIVKGTHNMGKIWYTGATGADVTAEQLQVKLTVDGTKADIDDYQLVCVLTTVDEGTDPYNPSAGFSKEPQLNVKYVYDFRSPFAGKLASDAFTHTKEVLLTNADVSNGYVTIPLNESYNKILKEYATTGKDLGESLHIRWYVTKNGEIIDSHAGVLDPINKGTHIDAIDIDASGKLGWYWNTATNFDEGGNKQYDPLAGDPDYKNDNVKNLLNMKFTNPTDAEDWSDYKVIVVMSNDISEDSGQEVNKHRLTHEPNVLNMQYVFSFYVEGSTQFVHYRGTAERPFLTKDDDENINSSVKQRYWDVATSIVMDDVSGDYRQGVHTVDYNIYLDPAGGTQRLKLPLELFDSDGNVLEPAAYIRWYDWKTDQKSAHLAIVGTNLVDMTFKDETVSRGYFWLNNSETAQMPRQATVGVTYDPSSLTADGDIIACDVSKYYDGIYKGVTNPTVMLHEPTLSTRYLFHIYPAEKIAGDIKTAAAHLTDGIAQLKSGTSYGNSTLKGTMFNLYEDNGRTVVSLNGSQGYFAVRANLSTLDNYFYYDSGNTLRKAFFNKDNLTDKTKGLRWYAYYEDDNGQLWYNDKPLTEVSQYYKQNPRVTQFQLSSLGGSYTLLSSSPSTKPITPQPGMKFHLVGCVTDGTNGEAPTIHYELQFIDAKPILVTDLATEAPERTAAYLDSHFTFGNRVNFDQLMDLSKPSSQNENMTYEPLQWGEAQYGFCYPAIDQYRIATSDNDGSGLTPIHGDYILLKSMNVPGLSDNNVEHTYKYHFYRSDPPLYDYTHTVNPASGHYGTFLYVDASDESRTIATLDFNAKLCSGSQIYFTAAIADVTGATGEATIAPQVMARVYAVDSTLVGGKWQ